MRFYCGGRRERQPTELTSLMSPKYVAGVHKYVRIFKPSGNSELMHVAELHKQIR